MSDDSQNPSRNVVLMIAGSFEPDFGGLVSFMYISFYAASKGSTSSVNTLSNKDFCTAKRTRSGFLFCTDVLETTPVCSHCSKKPSGKHILSSLKGMLAISFIKSRQCHKKRGDT